MSTIAEIKTTVEKINAEFDKRTKELFDSLDLYPTVDQNGRYHAPCDGYVWINQEVYLGGEYLPFDDEGTKPSHDLKIKIDIRLKDQFDMIFGSGELGKIWIHNNMEIAYYYTKVSTAVYNAVNKLLPVSGRKVVLVSEKGLGNSKTWIFKTSKFTRKCASLWGSNWYELFDAMSWEFAPGVPFELIRKKDGKFTYKSSFDNQEVRYEYSDNIIYS